VRALAPRGLHPIAFLGVGERLGAQVVEVQVFEAGALAPAAPRQRTALPVSQQGSKMHSAGMTQRQPFAHAALYVTSVSIISVRAL
jgi:hypothetical protein